MSISKWAWAALEDVADVTAGIPAPQGEEFFSDTGVPFVRVQDLGRLGSVKRLLETTDLIEKKTAQSLRLYPKGSVLFTKSGASLLLNQRAILGCDMHVVCHIGVAVPKELVTSDWLYYWLRVVDFRTIAHGANMPSLPLSKAKQIRVPIPTKNEQYRISQKIDEYFSEIDASVIALERARKNLKRYRAAVLKAAVEGRLTAQWRKTHPATEPASKLLERILAERRKKWEKAQLAKFAAAGKVPPKGWKDKYPNPASPDTANLPELPTGWCWTNLDQLKSWAMYGPRFSSEEYVDDGCLVLRTTDFSDTGTINLQTPPKLRLSDKDFERYKAEVGDLLITRTGSLGTLAVFQGGAKAIAGAFLIHYRLAVPMATIWYAFYFLKSPKGNRALTEGGAGVGRPNLNMPKIEAIPIPFPPQSEQERICAEIEERLTLTNSIAEALKRDFGLSSRLRQSILKRAFEGKLVPQGPNDEPASVLLEPICAERALSGSGDTRKSRKKSSLKGGSNGKKA